MIAGAEIALMASRVMPGGSAVAPPMRKRLLRWTPTLGLLLLGSLVAWSGAGPATQAQLCSPRGADSVIAEAMHSGCGQSGLAHCDISRQEAHPRQGDFHHVDGHGRASAEFLQVFVVFGLAAVAGQLRELEKATHIFS